MSAKQKRATFSITITGPSGDVDEVIEDLQGAAADAHDRLRSVQLDRAKIVKVNLQEKEGRSR